MLQAASFKVADCKFADTSTRGILQICIIAQAADMLSGRAIGSSDFGLTGSAVQGGRKSEKQLYQMIKMNFRQKAGL